MKFAEIINKYTLGEANLEETNAALKAAGANFHLNPGKNEIKPGEEGRFGLLDIGFGTMDKVEVKDGKLVNCDCGDMQAYCFFNGKKYEVKGTELVEL
jgi:hypothetical protein